MNKKIILTATLSVLLFSGVAFSAAPDALGPWADSVVTASQGLKKNGSPVDLARSNSSAVLGLAETTGTSSDANTTATNFYALGFGGSLTVGFDNAIINGAGNDVAVYEVTGGVYPDEKIKVEASHNGSDWVTLSESVARDASLDLGVLPCAKYVRVTDVSNPALFEATADGYDVDAVKALNSGESCNAGSSVQIVKTSDKSEVLTGETVAYTYKVTNTGDFNLSGVSVADDKCAVVSGPVGDDGDAVLELGETWTYSCSMELSETTTNVATVSSVDIWGHAVSDADELTVAVRELGCTLTQGYWKNHGLGSKHEDGAWNLLADAPYWLNVLLTPVRGNAWYQLAHQYAAALLNDLNGAYVPSDVQDAMDDAGVLLGNAPWNVSKAQKNEFTQLAGVLGGFNEGLTETPHCSEL